MLNQVGKIYRCGNKTKTEPRVIGGVTVLFHWQRTICPRKGHLAHLCGSLTPLLPEPL